MPDLQFVKAQGAGNDFVILDEGIAEVKQLSTLIPQLCDRHFGIGADGVLLLRSLGPGRGRVIFYNVDGRRAEMCGNGLRCAAHYLSYSYDRETEILMQTDMGERRCELLRSPALTKQQLRVEMGQIQVKPDEVKHALLHNGIETDGKQVIAMAASAGNPHLVLLAQGNQDILQREGPALSRHPAFANGCNVEWVQPLGDHQYEVEVFERGVGRTLACGSGACAVAAVMLAQGLEPQGQKMTIKMPGADLGVEWDPAGQALLSGPSQWVFSGIWPY